MNFFDLHCDTAYECYIKSKDFNKNDLAVSGEKGEIFENWHQTFAFWIKDDAENPWNLYQNMFSDFNEKLKYAPKNLKPIFAVEGGAVIEDKIERLLSLKQNNIRFITLTWNGENKIAGGALTDKGLTDFGVEVIREMNKLGLVADLSHLNKKSFYSAIEIAEKPIATHSNLNCVCDHKRNLDIQQVRLIAEKGGLIGLTFYKEFLGENFYKQFYKNIYTLCEMGLENNIAIGSDFDGGEMPCEAKDITYIEKIWDKLNTMGIENTVLNKIFYENALKYTLNL